MLGAQLQAALYSALAGASPSIAGGRVYDRVPAKPVFPYITIGDEQVLDDGNTCADAWEVFPEIHAWSRSTAGSKAEVKSLIAQIVPAVIAISSVSGFNVRAAEIQFSHVFRDPDGMTEHAAMTFRFLLDPSS